MDGYLIELENCPSFNPLHEEMQRLMQGVLLTMVVAYPDVVLQWRLWPAFTGIHVGQ